MSFRTELKYRISNSELLSLRADLLRQGMSILYPVRKINSVYFDNNNFMLFNDSENGILPRKKVRIRWYFDDLNKASLEEKFSSIEGRFKKTNSILINNNPINQPHRIFDSFAGELIPKCQVSYDREYFFYKGVRITFDQNIEYIKTESKIPFKESDCVIEVKAPHNFDLGFDPIIPLQNSRFSKYCRAIHLLYGLN